MNCLFHWCPGRYSCVLLHFLHLHLNLDLGYYLFILCHCLYSHFIQNLLFIITHLAFLLIFHKALLLDLIQFILHWYSNIQIQVYGNLFKFNHSHHNEIAYVQIIFLLVHLSQFLKFIQFKYLFHLYQFDIKNNFPW